MEEKYSQLIDIVYECMDKDMTYKNFEEAISHWVDDYNAADKKNDKLSLKEFSLEATKAGKPVCTRDGRKARIICFNKKDNTPIVALIECDNHAEILQCYHNDGKRHHYETSNNDLMMLPEKKVGYINIYKSDKTLRSTNYSIFDNEQIAINNGKTIKDYITTIKIEWNE